MSVYTSVIARNMSTAASHQRRVEGAARSRGVGGAGGDVRAGGAGAGGESSADALDRIQCTK